jgi:hypothetical protein
MSRNDEPCLNRRALIAGAVALTVPAGAVAGSMTPATDPVFAAIEAHKAVRARSLAALATFNGAEDRFVELMDGKHWTPRVDMSRHGDTFRPNFATSRADIEDHFARLASLSNIPPAKLDARKAKLIADFDADVARIDAAKELSGLATAEPEADRAVDIESAALKKAIRTTPTSLRGLLALLALIQDDAGFGGFVFAEDDVDAILATITKTVSRLAETGTGGAA